MIFNSKEPCICKGRLRGSRGSRGRLGLAEAGAVRGRSLIRTWKACKTLIYFQALQRKQYDDSTKSYIYISLSLSHPQRRPVKSNGSLVRTRMDPNAWGSRKLCKLCSTSICMELTRWVDLLRSQCLWNSYAPWQPGPCMSGGRCCSDVLARMKSMENMEQLVCLTEELPATHCAKHCSDSFAQFSFLRWRTSWSTSTVKWSADTSAGTPERKDTSSILHVCSVQEHPPKRSNYIQYIYIYTVYIYISLRDFSVSIYFDIYSVWGSPCWYAARCENLADDLRNLWVRNQAQPEIQMESARARCGPTQKNP